MHGKKNEGFDPPWREWQNSTSDDSMPYTILPHMADMRMRVRAASQKALFRDAARGLTTIMKPKTRGDATPITRTFSLTASDPTALLVDFLNEIVRHAYTNKETYRTMRFPIITETALIAALEAFPVTAFGEDVKAVTYHEANIRKNAHGEWETTLVFDI